MSFIRLCSYWNVDGVVVESLTVVKLDSGTPQPHLPRDRNVGIKACRYNN